MYVCMYMYGVFSAPTNQKVVSGVFSVSPAVSIVHAGSSQAVIVDCFAEKEGTYEEVLVRCYTPLNSKCI